MEAAARRTPAPRRLARLRQVELAHRVGIVTREERRLFLAFLLWTLVPLAVFMVGPGRIPSIWTTPFVASDGMQVGDQLQYLAWIREAGQHVLFSNRFDTLDDPRLFFHPMFSLSGLAWKLGISLQVAYLLWKPVGVLALFTGFAAYVRRTVSGGAGDRVVALTLALFYLTPMLAVMRFAGVEEEYLFPTMTVGLDMFPAAFAWGVYPTAIAVGLLPLAFLGMERIVDPDRRNPGRSGRWYVGWTAAACATASWLHPWQGLTVLLVAVAVVLMDRRNWRRYWGLRIPLGAAILPLAYYFVLSQTDSAWGTVSEPNDLPHHGRWLFYAALPLFAGAALGFWERALDFQGRVLRLWPLAGLVVYAGLDSSFFYHAFSGLSLPLAVLAVQGWRRLGLPRFLGVATAAALTLPGVAFSVDLLLDTGPAHFVTESEAAALAYLGRTDRPGAVLARESLATAVPAFAGRRTWTGHATWTPFNEQRKQRVEALFSGLLSAAEVRRTVTESRVSFAIEDCRAPDLGRILGSQAQGARRFGCATVYSIAR